MKPKLILHIGAPKCGSSSIQAFLGQNRKTLKDLGYLVPDEKLGSGGKVPGQHVWFLQSHRADLAEGERVVRDRLLSLQPRLPDDGSGGIILSAENLADNFGLEKLFTGLRQTFDIRIIAYVRRQDDFLLSSWQQWNVKVAPDFWTWLLRAIAVQRRGDWYFALTPWIREFGSDSITVRRFGRQYFEEGNLLADFCLAAGLPANLLDLDVPSENTGLSDAAVDFAFAVQDLFENAHDNDFYNMIRRWGGDAAQKTGDSSLLSITQRKALLTHFADSNKKIRDLFYADTDAPESLFDPPKGKGIQSARKTVIDPHAELLMRLVYGAYKEMKAKK